MTKQNFLQSLRDKLSGLPPQEVEERLGFYNEMIEDRMEEGLSEEAAVDAVGSIDDIVEQIIADTPLAAIAKQAIRPKRRLKTWETVLLILGSPIWGSLLIAAAAVAFSLYVCVWAVIVCFWAAFVSVAACALGGIVGGGILVVYENPMTGGILIGAGLVCAGLAVFLFFGCKAATKGVLTLTKASARGIKRRCIQKEAV